MKYEYQNKLYENYKATSRCVSIKKVGAWSKNIFDLLYPVTNDTVFKNEEEFESYTLNLEGELLEILSCSMNPLLFDVKSAVRSFFDNLTTIKEKLDKDVEAIYNGDPAAKSKDEIVRCYPGIFAIAMYRIANYLNNKGVETIPRIITEYAHGKTGIDIHPGAEIGEGFFIDHGTAVVIGETSVIGKNVKIYQGVTLGGLSVRKKDADEKRHPTIEDDVVIYAGATILGGKTIIGKGTIIGGNTFITKSVESNAKVYYNSENIKK